ncbi:MAG: hypothetical protein QOI64_1899 [Solirubrobacteraceae bacterium]|nr:hypothetical protein [Solirubrobacteraceae bacterium]
MAVKKTSKQRKAVKKICRKVKVKGSRRTKTVCRPKKKKVVRRKVVAPAAKPPASVITRAPVTGGGPVPVPSPAAPPVTTPPAPGPAPPEQPPPTAAGLPVYDATFGVAQAQRLLWRAGFGPRSGQAEALAELGVVAAVRSLTRPSGAATLTGAAPTVGGAPIAPYDAWGHDHLWWLDRMVRSDQPLVERMALIWHDWLATTNADVNNRPLMRTQNELFRRHALGSFAELITDVTTDPAMLIFLSGIENRRQAPNENYARELMELFTLGADRGAYTETDVRSLARALTGWRADWSDAVGFNNFRFDTTRYDATSKTLWAGTSYERSGTFGWRDACSLVLENPFHRSHFVAKLWSYFVPSPPSAGTQAALESLYVTSGHSIAQVVEAILLHPDLYTGAPLVKPPAVYIAGLLRATDQTIAQDAWVWLAALAGQQLFYPPNVSGWNERAWLDTSTTYGRWYVAYYALAPKLATAASYAGSTETGAQALATAIDAAGRPALTAETYATLLAFAEQPAPAGTGANDFRALRQNALRQLAASSPDAQLS